MRRVYGNHCNNRGFPTLGSPPRGLIFKCLLTIIKTCVHNCFSYCTKGLGKFCIYGISLVVLGCLRGSFRYIVSASFCSLEIFYPPILNEPDTNYGVKNLGLMFIHGIMDFVLCWQGVWKELSRVKRGW